ncbi:deoxyguanosine kinase [Terribacillus saccharophilus]|uniref:Deoxyguanosine kinase n=1 Tax=Terribacillus saccharophilus TaxID=361277 RepID=A0A075LRX7_9BACI|nr:deoxynucleoside kinase [Terribacillus goriensis]AIF67228.1 deoxyguanosine kinase [Terribacillus goriensis]
MHELPFIAVEGPIGVGKTSLAKKIADHFQYALLKEIVEENPFLGKFYENIEEWSFQLEMFFLTNRYKQLNDIRKDYLSQNQPVVADYHIAKNMIFAQRTLAEPEFDKYSKIFSILTEDIALPNMVIYLDASLETLLERIEMRDRKAEQHIQPDYLKQLSADYQTFMDLFEQDNPDIPVLRLSGDELDFVKNEQDWKYICDRISSHLDKGVTSS